MARARGRWIKRLLLGVSALAVTVALALSIVGVPAPPSATVSGVPRIPWRAALPALPMARRMLGETRLLGWDPWGGLFVTGYDGLSPRVHRLAEPRAQPQPTSLPPRASGLSVNPDPSKRYAVFTLDAGGDESRRLYRWDMGDATTTALTPAGAKVWLGPWSRDGSHIAYATEGKTEGDRDLFVMDPRKPDSARRVFEGQGSWSVADWSPDGRRLLVSEYRSVVHSRPHILELENAEVRPLVPLEPASRFSSLRFTADPDVVLFVSNRDNEFSQLRTVTLSTGAVSLVGQEVPWDVSGVVASRDRRRFAVGRNEDGVVRWYVLDPRSGRRESLLAPAKHHIVAVRFAPDGSAVAVTTKGPSGATSVGVIDLESSEYEAWSEPQSSEDAPLPPVRLVRFETFDRVGDASRRIPTFVFDAPADAPKPAPVVIRIHGGPEGQSRGYPNPLYDVLRRELGVAVITPNVRGSTGYGKTYVGLDDGRRREDSVRDIGALLDWIAEQPELDPERVIVYGGSYGGYMVLASLVHFPDRIRCGVDVVGISNFVSFLENTKPYRRQLRRNEYGDERDPQMRAFLESISPLTRADEIRADLLVIQGANDPRVPASESRRVVERLRELGREVWYLEFDDEGHGLRMPINVAYAAAVGQTFAQRCLEP